MSKALEYLIVIGLITTAVITAWSVLTANHLHIG
ncbi:MULTISPECIES: hypothetical protein [Campylobacter]|uniref:Uncharacterized protein n=1 Tax=Campylobacter taeniopygiae TaxID=2510188 RepID=A0ABY2TLB8_9BACT|nr:hypothetical protein [Campylobacter taeniopygiae]MBZ7935321.1 hypothetical protein [Campylobacter sp. B0100352/1]MBZ7938736.1 hypothetical protein [Campylobacter sp. W0014]MBZ7953752.1 hypothetical protein [Campylobacter sp. W0018]MBZ7963825.1 hypothetical protein [Campylobacter sp. 2457A]TKX34691.1 hypothetical protein CQA75_00110 [Campylobacter taeniopygiae]